MKIPYRVKAIWSLLIGKSAVVPKSFERDDYVLGTVRIHTTSRYTRLSIEGRELFFTPDGRFDGAGMGCSANSDLRVRRRTQSMHLR